MYGNWNVEPHGTEIALQIGYVLAAGAKGLTMFQTILDDMKKESSDWQGIVKSVLLSVANPVVREVRTSTAEGVLSASRKSARVQRLFPFLSTTGHEMAACEASRWCSLPLPLCSKVVRTGDIQAFDFKTSDTYSSAWVSESIVQVIRNHEYILVVALNTKVDGYSNLIWWVTAGQCHP